MPGLREMDKGCPCRQGDKGGTTVVPQFPGDNPEDDEAYYSTEALLSVREKTHGPYKLKCMIIQELKEVMRSHDTWDALTDVQKESLDMIVHKIGRILSGDPNFPDHWEDIAGYAKLVVVNGPK
jgi:hypothetical protein